MRKEDAVNCWEYFDCDSAKRDRCFAYNTGTGKECWIMANSFPSYTNNGDPEVKKRNCWDCPWFKKKGQGFVNE